MVGGLGTYSSWSSLFSPSGYTTSSEVVYFKKNGIECLQEVVMGVPDAAARPADFSLSPNPSEGLIKITSDKPVLRAEVIDTQGQLVANIALDALRGKLDLRVVSNGLYLVCLYFIDGRVGTQRVLIGR